jgi:hypothetical protein
MAFTITAVTADFSLGLSSNVRINFLVFNAVSDILNRKLALKGAAL